MKKITLLAFLMAGALCASAATPISKTVKSLPQTKGKTEVLATRANGLVPQAIDVQHMRGAKAITEATTWDFEDAEQFAQFTIADNDGDGFNWEYYNNTGLETGRMTAHGGEGLISSKSYDNDGAGALTPDNWLISPEVTLGGALKFWACGQDANYAAEVFGVYVCVGDPSNVANFVQVGADLTATGDYVEYEFDLSAYAGQNGYFAIRHYNVTDMFMLNIDDITFDPNAVAFNAPGVPKDLAVVPGSTTADVTWTAGSDNVAANLRYRQCDNVAKVNRFLDLPNDDEILDEQLYGVYALDADGDGYGWGLAYTDSEQTDLCFYSASYYNSTSLDPDNWLLFPVKLGGSLKFKAQNYMSYYPDNLGVFVCPNKNYASMDEFVQVGADFEPSADEFTPYEFDLSNEEWNGKIGWVAIRHYNSYDMYRLYIDDIEITVPDPDEELIVYDWTVVEDLDEASYTIDGLTPETEYEVQVQGINRIETPAKDEDENEKVSDWTASVYFTTLAAEEETVYYVLGFNDWNNPIEIGEDGATVEVEAQNFEDANDTAQEFKIVTAAEDGGWIWYGGEDANGAGFFDLTDWMDSPITLYDDPAPAVQNFRLPEAGTYTIKLVADRAALEGLKMIVTKETVVGIDTIKSEVKGDNNYYNLMGQKMNGNNLPAGIYIHNGKKVVIK